ncbi:hypothetical protein HRbin15_02705 [bacterium HR15]|nr:hypothetical protein HRbin15_02705 [bacterium HR15]
MIGGHNETLILAIIIGIAGIFIIQKAAPRLAFFMAEIIAPRSIKLQINIAFSVWFGIIGAIFWIMLRFANLLHGGVLQCFVWVFGFSAIVHVSRRVWRLFILGAIGLLTWLLE